MMVLVGRCFMMLLELPSDFLHDDVRSLVSLGRGVLHGLFFCYG
jgi:hypothetical protein